MKLADRGRLALLACLTAIAGCHVGRHYDIVPERNQVLYAESGDRFFFDLEEDAAAGYSWRATCADADVSVAIAHGAGGRDRAEVEIRVHRGYDGPSTILFAYQGAGAREPLRKFVITLHKRTGDRAFWE